MAACRAGRELVVVAERPGPPAARLGAAACGRAACSDGAAACGGQRGPWFVSGAAPWARAAAPGRGGGAWAARGAPCARAGLTALCNFVARETASRVFTITPSLRVAGTVKSGRRVGGRAEYLRAVFLDGPGRLS